MMTTDDDDDGFARTAVAIEAADRAARGLAASVGSGLRRAMADAALGSASLSDALRGLARDVARSALGAATRPLADVATAGVAGLADAAARAVVGGFSSSAVRGFAAGGVVTGPTTFATAGGVGVMGEAGPEAIMPLARGADGRLGVRGGGGVSVTVNVVAADAASFARSEPQIAAALARAVARGRRRL
jgi:phage-related minor tail protein